MAPTSELVTFAPFSAHFKRHVNQDKLPFRQSWALQNGCRWLCKFRRMGQSSRVDNTKSKQVEDLIEKSQFSKNDHSSWSWLACRESWPSISPSIREISPTLSVLCDSPKHFPNQCAKFQILTKEKNETWIRSNHQIWCHGWSHQAAQCNLRSRCKTCSTAWGILTEVNLRPPPERSFVMIEMLYQPAQSGCTSFNVSKVVTWNRDQQLEVYAILDETWIRAHHSAPSFCPTMGLPGKSAGIWPSEQRGRMWEYFMLCLLLSPPCFTTKLMLLFQWSIRCSTAGSGRAHILTCLITKWILASLWTTSPAFPRCFHSASDWVRPPSLKHPNKACSSWTAGGPAVVKTKLSWTL